MGIRMSAASESRRIRSSDQTPKMALLIRSQTNCNLDCGSNLDRFLAHRARPSGTEQVAVSYFQFLGRGVPCNGLQMTFNCSRFVFLDQRSRPGREGNFFCLVAVRRIDVHDALDQEFCLGQFCQILSGPEDRGKDVPSSVSLSRLAWASAAGNAAARILRISAISSCSMVGPRGGGGE